MNFRIIITLVIYTFLVSSCDKDRLYEENREFTNYFWKVDSTLTFNFHIENPDSTYTLFLNVRNTNEYEFHNLFVHYYLIDDNKDTLDQQLKEFYLFDPKTGQPYGAGLGDIFDHRMPMIESLQLPNEGDYTLSLRQYMRRDSLNEILSAGIRLEYRE